MKKQRINYVIAIPFYNNSKLLIKCVNLLLKQLNDAGVLLLFNDGSNKDELIKVKKKFNLIPNIYLISNKKNCGVSITRNKIFDWSKKNNAEILIMIDSDSEPKKNFITNHLKVHNEIKNAAVLGGGIYGKSKSFWGTIDKYASWVHSIPFKKRHRVKFPFHLPTNNMSIKLSFFSKKIKIFKDFLITGEDADFVKDCLNNKLNVYFSPEPKIYHNDRKNLSDVIDHQINWGHHQYFMLTKKNNYYFSFNIYFRIIFLLLFVPISPFYCLIGAFLNIYPWLKYEKKVLLYAPFIFTLWIGKTIALINTCIYPEKYCKKDYL